MNPAEYILPPDEVKARFPAELVGTPDYRTIIDACIERLRLPESAIVAPRKIGSGVRIRMSNDESDDFRCDYVTVTVSRPESHVRIENLTVDSAAHLARAEAFASSETHRRLGYFR